jgi:hypothetical protein
MGIIYFINLCVLCVLCGKEHFYQTNPKSLVPRLFAMVYLPNEPNAAWPKRPASGWHLQAQLVGGHSEHSKESLTSNFSLLPFPFFTSVSSAPSVAKKKTNPIFLRPNMRYQYQKPRNGGQKTTQKNETNPILTKS